MAGRPRGMSTQEYRASYDYRREYFKYNPGLFGCIWFCSQCFKPLFGKKNVVIDHIRPLSKGGANHVSNCTSCCRKCNAAKSDIIDGRMIRGYMYKTAENIAGKTNRGVGLVAALGLGLTAGVVNAGASVGYRALKGTGRVGRKTTVGIVGLLTRATFGCAKVGLSVATIPLRVGSILSRLMFVAIYAMFAMHFLSKNTPIFNAWM